MLFVRVAREDLARLSVEERRCVASRGIDVGAPERCDKGAGVCEGRGGECRWRVEVELAGVDASGVDVKDGGNGGGDATA